MPTSAAIFGRKSVLPRREEKKNKKRKKNEVSFLLRVKKEREMRGSGEKNSKEKKNSTETRGLERKKHFLDLDFVLSLSKLHRVSVHNSALKRYEKQGGGQVLGTKKMEVDKKERKRKKTRKSLSRLLSLLSVPLFESITASEPSRAAADGS